MIRRNQKAVKQFLFWVFVATLSMTVFLGMSIYFTDDTGDIFHSGFFSSLRVAMLIFGLIAFVTLKKYVSHGLSRNTFFRESTVFITAISIYALILTNIFGWILNSVPALEGEIVTDVYLDNIIIMNITAFIGAILFYYIGLTIFYSFRKNVWLGILISIVLGSTAGILNFSDLVYEQPVILLIIFTASTALFGYTSFRVLKTAVIKV